MNPIVTIEKDAQKYFNKLQKRDKNRISKALAKLPDGDKEKMRGTAGLWRLRVGTLRILYSIIEQKNKVGEKLLQFVVRRIGNRGDVYNLKELQNIPAATLGAGMPIGTVAGVFPFPLVGAAIMGLAGATGKNRFDSSLPNAASPKKSEENIPLSDFIYEPSIKYRCINLIEEIPDEHMDDILFYLEEIYNKFVLDEDEDAAFCLALAEDLQNIEEDNELEDFFEFVAKSK
ncbi:MAG: hypothetical protein FWG64_12545 [Firmicutes bacterium]|nr:hypothetical protein [Bacillota bacterium]